MIRSSFDATIGWTQYEAAESGTTELSVRTPIIAGHAQACAIGDAGWLRRAAGADGWPELQASKAAARATAIPRAPITLPGRRRP
jgi:hypothetical protein